MRPELPARKGTSETRGTTLGDRTCGRMDPYVLSLTPLDFPPHKSVHAVGAAPQDLRLGLDRLHRRRAFG